MTITRGMVKMVLRLLEIERSGAISVDNANIDLLTNDVNTQYNSNTGKYLSLKETVHYLIYETFDGFERYGIVFNEDIADWQLFYNN